MAGVIMGTDGEKDIAKVQVPTIGGIDGVSPTATIADMGHTDSNQFRAEGVPYGENFGVDVTTEPYPQGTAMKDTSPGDDVN